MTTTTDKAYEEFMAWLPSVCFQRPTPEAEDLAWAAWKHQRAEIELLRCAITRIVEADKNNTGAEPSVSVLARSISEASQLFNQPGEKE